MRMLDPVPALCVCVCARVCVGFFTHSFNVENTPACFQDGWAAFLTGEPVCDAAFRHLRGCFVAFC